ncbi:tetratricopeptide repeat protein, partial [Barnesiella sp. GGCC_0306]|nr:tetratricopeptide repeat protein [Barnesiella sp. GGCC_0306]
MKYKISFLVIMFFPSLLFSQIISQPGHVRKISYNKSNQTVPVSDVRLKVETESRSDDKGDFTLFITSNKRDTFVFERIYKQDYTLISPPAKELSSTKYALNPHVKVEIVVANTKELQAERRRIETNIRTQKESEIARYEKIISEKDAELSAMKEKNARYDQLRAERDSLEKVLNEFSVRYYDSDKYILEEADKLSRIDYQSLDSIEIVNTDLRKQGKGREMIEYNKSLLPVNEASIADFLPDMIARTESDLKKQKELRDFLVQRYKDIADGFWLEYQNDSASCYLEKRLSLEPDNYDYLTECGNFFLIYIVDYKKAKEYITRSLDIARKENGEESNQVAASYNNIGRVYDSQGDYAKAMEYYNKSLLIYGKVFGPDHPNVAALYNNIGGIYDSQGDYVKSLEYYNKSLLILEKFFGPDHSDVAALYNNIGLVYSSQGDYVKSLEHYNKSLLILEKIFSPDHPNVAISYNNIGGIYDSQGDYAKSFEYYNKSLLILEKLFGPDHPDVARLYNNIGRIYSSQGDYNKSLEYYNKSLLILEKLFVSDHPDVAALYNNIGDIYSSQGDYANSLEYYNKSLSILENVFGLDHPDVARLYNNIGRIYDSQGDYEKSLEYYNKSLSIYENVFGLDHPDVARLYNNI